MRDFTKLTYKENCDEAKRMYEENEEFRDYVHREARQGNYTIEELLGMAHVHYHMDCLINRY